MKKYISFISAVSFAATLLFCSCSKEETIAPSEQHLQYEFSIDQEDGNDVDTKAIKTGWTEGDLVYVIFDGVLPASTSEILVLKYVSKKWKVIQEPSKLPSGSQLDALYYENPNPTITVNSKYVSFDTIDDLGQWMFLKGNKVSYTISNGVLKATIPMKLVSTGPQVCVIGLTGDWSIAFTRDDYNTSAWGVARPCWDSTNRFVYTDFSWHANDSYPVKMRVKSDGNHYVYLHSLYGASDQHVWKVTLKSSTYGTWVKTFNKSVELYHAITFEGPRYLKGSEVAGDVNNGWYKQGQSTTGGSTTVPNPFPGTEQQW